MAAQLIFGKGVKYTPCVPKACAPGRLTFHSLENLSSCTVHLELPSLFLSLFLLLLLHWAGHLRYIIINIYIKIRCRNMDTIERLTEGRINVHIYVSWGGGVLYSF